jgi:hypothetical protein
VDRCQRARQGGSARKNVGLTVVALRAGVEDLPAGESEISALSRSVSVDHNSADSHGCLPQVVEGLRCVHHQGVVHRDVKTLNVFEAEDGTMKLGPHNITHAHIVRDVA